MSPKPKDKSGAVYDELTSENKKNVDASRFMEIDNLLKLGALCVMSVKDSEHFAKTTPENVISTHMLNKWKRQDDGTVKAKSRIVSEGRKDPLDHHLERAGPTPTQEAITVTLQWLASAKVSGKVTDLTNAFSLSRKTSRKNKLAMLSSPLYFQERQENEGQARAHHSMNLDENKFDYKKNCP